MSFRDDHDAALARAAALERELEREREKVDAQAAKLEQAARERAQIETELACHRADCASPEPSPPPRPPERARRAPQRSSETMMIALALEIAALLIFIVAASGGEHANQRGWGSAPNPPCTLDTIPSGAEIYAIHPGSAITGLNESLGSPASLQPTSFETLVGTTPITKSRLEWIADGVVGSPTYEARLAGLAPLEVYAPVEGLGCRATPFRFPVAEAPAP